MEINLDIISWHGCWPLCCPEEQENVRVVFRSCESNNSFSLSVCSVCLCCCCLWFSLCLNGPPWLCCFLWSLQLKLYSGLLMCVWILKLSCCCERQGLSGCWIHSVFPSLHLLWLVVTAWAEGLLVAWHRCFFFPSLFCCEAVLHDNRLAWDKGQRYVTEQFDKGVKVRQCIDAGDAGDSAV